MNLPLQVTFRNIPPSEAIETNINQKAAKLDKFYGRIMSCRVVVESTQRRHHQGKLYGVRIDITVPGGELAVTREENEDVYTAIRDAFDAGFRQLEQYARRRRGDIKSHHQPLTGRLIRIFPSEAYGFIQTPDEREIYFHRNSILNEEFDRLKVGTEVSFVEEQGKEGPQAVRVAINKRQVAA